MSWLSDRLGVHLNLRPLAAPVGAIAGGLLGGPAGAALGAGLFKTGDNLAHGDSVGHALGQGALNAGVAGLGAGGLDKLRAAFGGSEAAAGAAGGFTPGSSVPGYLGQAAINGGEDAGKSAISSGLGALGSSAKDVGSWIAAHPTAVGQGLQGVGQIAQSGAENAYRKAQTDALNLNNQTDQYALDAKKKRDQQLAPLIAAFQGRAQDMATNPMTVGRNPYTPY